MEGYLHSMLELSSGLDSKYPQHRKSENNTVQRNQQRLLNLQKEVTYWNRKVRVKGNS